MYARKSDVFTVADVFDDFFGPMVKTPQTRWVTPVSETNVILEMALPGYSKADVVVTTEDDLVTVEGKAKGFVSSDFKKSWRLGNYRLESTVLRDGILSLTFATIEKKQSKTIVDIQ